MLSVIVIIINAVALFFLLLEIVKSKRAQLQVRQRIDGLGLRGDANAKPQPIDLHRKTRELPGIFKWLTKPLPVFERLGHKFERLGKNITPKQYILRRVMITLIIIFIVSGLIKKSLVVGLLLGLIFGVLLPFKVLQWQLNKHTKKFLKLFPEAIDLIVRGLRAGLPVTESMRLVSQEIEEPVGSVFTTVVNTLKLGVPLEKALHEEARKLDIPEFNFFTISIRLQRETGGNLTEILSNLSEVLRNRSRMLLKIGAMSAEARASSYVLSVLPFLIIICISIFSPNYLIPLYQDERGYICVAAALFMIVSGLWIMRRMTQFEI
jgi:tight adherence protein B